MGGDALQVTVEARERYRAQEPVPVELTVKNVSAQPLLVNNRMLVNHPISPGELAFSVRGRDDREYLLRALRVPRELNDRDFVVLQPGQSVKHTVDLGREYGLTEAGTYEVKATYRNRDEWSQGGLSAWKGEVGSAGVAIRVE